MEIKNKNSTVLATKKKKIPVSIIFPVILIVVLGISFLLNSRQALADTNIELSSQSIEGLSDAENETNSILFAEATENTNNTLDTTRVLAEGSSGNEGDTLLVYFVKPVLWTKENNVTIQVEVVNGKNEKVKCNSIKAKINEESWEDITESSKIEISQNGTLYVEIVSENGQVINKSQNIEIFDKEPPSVTAKKNGNLLIVEATDTQSGVESVFIDGNEISYPSGGNIQIELDKLPTNIEKITLQSSDKVGNLSSKFAFSNPMYQSANNQIVSSQNSVTQYSAVSGATGTYNGTVSSNGATGTYNGTVSSNGATGTYNGTVSSNGATGTYNGTVSSNGATGTYNGTVSSNGTTGTYNGTVSSNGATGTYNGTVSSNGVTGTYNGTVSSNGASGEQGLASTIAGDTMMTTEDGTLPSKQFVTVVTKEGQTFYLIIDNEKETNNVYFLTEIDLENLAEAGSTKGTISGFDDTDTGNLIYGGESSNYESSKTESKTEDSSLGSSSNEEEAEKNGSLSFLGVIVLGIIVFLILFFLYQRFVVMKRKEAEDNVQQDDTEEEDINRVSPPNNENELSDDGSDFFNQNEEEELLDDDQSEDTEDAESSYDEEDYE